MQCVVALIERYRALVDGEMMSEICKTKEEVEEYLHEFVKYITEYRIYYGFMKEIERNNRADNHPITQRISSTFFGMVYRSFEFNVLSILHRIYDKNSDSVDIETVITTIYQNVDKYGLNETEKERIISIVNEFQKTYNSLEEPLKKLRRLRNKTTSQTRYVDARTLTAMMTA